MQTEDFILSVGMHLSSASWTIVTVCWSTCRPVSSRVCNPFRMLLPGSSSTWGNPNTSPMHWSAYTGFVRVPERIIFKAATLTSRALHGTAPPYMTSQFTHVADMPKRRRLRSASSNQLDVPSFRLPTAGSHAFPTARAKVWNSLPDNVTSASSLSTFQRHLKSHLFRYCYNTLWFCCTYSDYSGPRGGVAA